eukprot:1195085-Prorocentrum_minimum.AAC.4
MYTKCKLIVTVVPGDPRGAHALPSNNEQYRHLGGRGRDGRGRVLQADGTLGVALCGAAAQRSNGGCRRHPHAAGASARRPLLTAPAPLPPLCLYIYAGAHDEQLQGGTLQPEARARQVQFLVPVVPQRTGSLRGEHHHRLRRGSYPRFILVQTPLIQHRRLRRGSYPRFILYQTPPPKR